MLSAVSEAASEGMLFSAICAPSRFHTAKTRSGLGSTLSRVINYTATGEMVGKNWSPQPNGKLSNDRP